MSLLVQFSFLQVLDFLTTLAFLLHGVREANPVVRLAMKIGSTPLGGLLILKLLAVCLAIYCVRKARLRLLARVNALFAGIVTWNLCALILAA